LASATGSELVVRLARTINASPARVWEFVGTDTGMREWLGFKLYEPRLGGRTLIDTVHEGQRWIMYGAVTVFEAERELAFTWVEVDAGKRTVWPADTLVTVRLTPQGEATLVELLHSGFEALPDGAAQFEGYKSGWGSLNDLEHLAAMCEKSD
jgi:uncharacterized protein YndB with AHSA1/START domain